MINTYQTSVAPPPLPPRLDRPQPLLIPATMPSHGHSRPLLRFLVCVMLLQLLLSVGGFLYLYYNMRVNGGTPVEGKTASLSSGKTTSSKTWAQMIVEQPPKNALKALSGHLQWDMIHSIRRNVNYYQRSWLTVLQPGDYYVFSRVTFSKAHSKSPLASIVKLKKSKAAEEKVVMLAYCSLGSHASAAAAPGLCTATQGEVMVLESGDQLSVWVEDVSLVDYSEGATAFGMYKL